MSAGEFGEGEYERQQMGGQQQMGYWREREEF